MRLLTLTARPRIPEQLAPLATIAHDLWFSWNYDAKELFRQLDYDRWIASGYNPTRMLAMTSQERLEAVAADDAFVAELAQVYERYQTYLANGELTAGLERNGHIGYFSMEFGLAGSLPIYSGGLGMLAGDHLKAASDLNLPLVGVGLLYRKGYFRQLINHDGYQQETYPENDWYQMPVQRCTGASGTPQFVELELAGDAVVAQLWEVRVGRVRLILLDTNLEANPPAVREITATLYGGDRETRIRQEILLGVGGVRALGVLGIRLGAAHINEGHAAFLCLERIDNLMTAHRVSFEAARQIVAATTVFTTHTPVPAGNERFQHGLVERYLKDVADRLGIAWHDFLALGRENPGNDKEEFCMTVLALRLAAYSNGVSKLHGDVTRRMWRAVWPGLAERELPIGHVTNGVHPRSWIARDLVQLFDRHLGTEFRDSPGTFRGWSRIRRIPDEELWGTHRRLRERLVAFVRDRLVAQARRPGGSRGEVEAAERALNPDALTICFARRMAAYKRPHLILRDPERLARLVNDDQRPVQLVFAGKAHPHDGMGKDLIKQIVHLAARPELAGRIVFLENYDYATAQRLVAGSDLWLNNPRRPLEASGTSGMKAALNGVLNVSTLDGWWAEAYRPEIGWSIGNGEEYADHELQDHIEAQALYDLLEREIIPTFYDRGPNGVPQRWLEMMRAIIRRVGARFTTHRMVAEYAEWGYQPALEADRALRQDQFRRARELAEYVQQIRAAWPALQVTDLSCSAGPVVEVGDRLDVRATVELDSLRAEQLQVQLLIGRVDTAGELVAPRAESMSVVSGNGAAVVFGAEVTCRESGRVGMAVRIAPNHADLPTPLLAGLSWDF